jgi:hypothetical protein
MNVKVNEVDIDGIVRVSIVGMMPVAPVGRPEFADGVAALGGHGMAVRLEMWA